MEQSKIVLVTGGSRGLGKNMALRLADKGMDVILTYHSKQEEAEQVVADIKAKGQRAVSLPLDTSKTETFESFFSDLREALKNSFETDKIHYLVNNAGVGVYAPFVETTKEQFDEVMNIQLKGTFFLTQKALQLMEDGGGIVNVSTGLARFALPGYAAYAAMKGAVETLTTYLAKELGGRKIRANTVAPGAIETDFGGGVVRDNQELNQYIASSTALGRTGLPEDIGGVVAFLCTDDARWINAQRIEVSGGQMI